LHGIFRKLSSGLEKSGGQLSVETLDAVIGSKIDGILYHAEGMAEDLLLDHSYYGNPPAILKLAHHLPGPCPISCPICFLAQFAKDAASPNCAASEPDRWIGPIASNSRCRNCDRVRCLPRCGLVIARRVGEETPKRLVSKTLGLARTQLVQCHWQYFFRKFSKSTHVGLS